VIRISMGLETLTFILFATFVIGALAGAIIPNALTHKRHEG
jgi:hypothetical protein